MWPKVSLVFEDFKFKFCLYPSDTLVFLINVESSFIELKILPPFYVDWLTIGYGIKPLSKFINFVQI